MNCSFTEKVSFLIDGELSQAEAREVERHLLTCAQCQEVRADFLNLRSQIASFEASLPPAVQNRALAKILSGRRSERAASGRGLTWRWNWGSGAVALASIAIVALIIVLNFYKQPEQVAIQSPPPAPSPDMKPSPQDEPQKPETPRRQPPPRRPAPVREPKPGEQFAAIPERVRSADAQTMTALHFEKAETLLRAFRNMRLDEAGATSEVSYERKRAQQLVYQNMMLRREADASGDAQIASLLESLEPILLDIANLPDKPDDDTVRVIRERVERKNIVALLQVNSTALARALD
jgi:transposase-like protein